MELEDFSETAIEDWDFFLPRNHKNQPIENKQYRIFQPEWQSIILLWFENNEIPKVEKEAFIQALINFEDGCVQYEGKGFYGYQAYFLAAAAIDNFQECEQADEIVEQIVNWKLDNSFSCIQDKITDALQKTDKIKAVSVLETILSTSKDEENFGKIADILCEINFVNTPSINALIQIINTSINALIQIINTSNNEEIIYESVFILKKAISRNQTMIDSLLELIQISQGEDRHERLISLLEKIYSDIEKTIAALVQLIHRFQNESIFFEVARCLGNIGADNQEAINALVQLLEISQDRSTLSQIAKSLGYIGNEEAINALVRLIDTSQSELVQVYAAYSLQEIDPDNEKAIAALVHVLDTSQNDLLRCDIANSLKNIDSVIMKKLLQLYYKL
ncbi:HEAT repeat domain-containing protein [Anabaena catenula]|uniref:HEAT repeat domain-containing protein n=1 Tax=Anabaena catenula FACHB-362 TaxID=2692877 RepID=A0ABR8J6B0_9NOST|nr:HEAT repeat domain-containing protein [Anabaena catenula]MBD2693110.1 HEAT repeat domain-containing protein [Anabaena catenula FACHB-362]